MMKLLSIFCILIVGLAAATGCATSEPRYADPPPGSHSPSSEFDERQSGDRMRDEPEPEPDTEEEDEPAMPPPEMN